MKKIAAFLDVDGTIFRNSLLIEHFKLLVKYEFIDESSFVGEVKSKLKKWEERKGSYDDYLQEVVDTYLSYLRKINMKDAEYVADRVIETRSSKLYSYTTKAIEEHLKKGHLVILISGSPDFIVQKMAKKLNVTDAIGTGYLVCDDNTYTGETVPMWDSENKMKAIDNFVKKYNIDLEQSYAYGDTSGDFGMFVKVGHPIAINPAYKLIDRIKNSEIKDRVKIIIERKDVIYELDTDVQISKNQ